MFFIIIIYLINVFHLLINSVIYFYFLFFIFLFFTFILFFTSLFYLLIKNLFRFLFIINAFYFNHY